MINFEYNEMWHHYVDNVGEPTDDIYVKVYNANYVDNKNKCVPFLNHGMDAFKIKDSDPLLSHGLFQHGTFVVANKKANRCKNLFIVMPKKQDDLFVADHFTFFLNKGVSKENTLQLHWTLYYPVFGNIGGATIHIYCDQQTSLDHMIS